MLLVSMQRDANGIKAGAGFCMCMSEGHHG